MLPKKIKFLTARNSMIRFYHNGEFVSLFKAEGIEKQIEEELEKSFPIKGEKYL